MSDVSDPWADPATIELTTDIAASYANLLGAPLLPMPDGTDELTAARMLYEAPFALLAHDGAEDPRFTYVNATAQQLWEREWQQFIGLPSRLSAEPDARHVRAEMLRRVGDDGFVTGYRGVRISAGGRRFLIDDAQIWNVTDSRGQPRGQAARIDTWTFLD